MQVNKYILIDIDNQKIFKKKHHANHETKSYESNLFRPVSMDLCFRKKVRVALHLKQGFLGLLDLRQLEAETAATCYYPLGEKFHGTFSGAKKKQNTLGV